LQASYVWDTSIGDAGGTDHASNWLVVARRAPETNAKLDTLLAVPSATSHSYSLGVLALVVLVAVVGGVAIGILADSTSGAIAGIATIVGGLLAVVLRNLPGGTRRSTATDAS
jgi:hypothetical protein